MIGQITPLVQAAMGKRRWVQATVGHIAGATLSAAFLGVVLAACGVVLGLDRRGPPVGVVAVVVLICALQDAGAWHGWRPHLQRQTPAWFRQVFGPVWGAVAWGIDLGQGWTTLILFSGYYALVVWAVLSAQPTVATAVLGAYGLGRGLPVLTTGLRARGVHLGVLATSYLTRLPLLYRINALALAVVAGYMLTGR